MSGKAQWSESEEVDHEEIDNGFELVDVTELSFGHIVTFHDEGMERIPSFGLGLEVKVLVEGRTVGIGSTYLIVPEPLRLELVRLLTEQADRLLVKQEGMEG